MAKVKEQTGSHMKKTLRQGKGEQLADVVNRSLYIMIHFSLHWSQSFEW
jgi:hypothetical protein